MDIHPVAIPTPDGISCEYGILHDEGEERLPRVLVVSFAGQYPTGSEGNPHGHFIAHATIHGLSAFNPWCLILDMRELSYQWGNSLLAVFDDADRYMSGDDDSPVRFPIVVVTSSKCRDAFLSLVTPHGGARPEWHFDDMEPAIAYALAKAREWIDA